ncbi:MAG: alkaline phosphatase family protein, partial [Peptococcaceae bacterium]|nr:alkaline phosphatase family protein [Peptococcaceae bacterium]
PDDGQGTMGKMPYDVVLSQIKPAAGWVDAPVDALEVIVLFSKGMIRRVGLITKNEQGVYDTLSLYKNKKAEEPYAVLPKGEFVKNINDEVIKDDVKYNASRNMRVLEMAKNGSRVKLWVSEAMNVDEDTLWHPKELHKIVTENCGPAVTGCMLGGYDEQLLKECMVPQWSVQGEWVANSLNYLIDNEGYQVVFSHYHNVDLQGHMIVKFMKNKLDYLPEKVYADVMELVYIQTDEYVGRFMHYLDEGWTIIITSDHAQACPEHGPIAMGEPMGVNVRLMQELGYTVLKTDENGNEIAELDWEKTRAVAVRGNHIYINLKGRNPHGIVDPADQYELEEQIMTDLYGYKHPVTGKRVFAMALRNRDALIMGLSGEGCGDIIYWTSEGYHFDHGDALATTFGYADTSISPIFIAAGNGIKQGFTTDRVIREVDVTPTIAAILGVRMPAQCEGAPAYQILDGEF